MYRGKPAVTINYFGEGAAVYIGTFADEGFYSVLVDWLMRKKKIESALPSANGFEATERSSSNQKIVFALNYNDDAIQIPCNRKEFEDVISGEKIKGLLKIQGLNAKILKRC